MTREPTEMELRVARAIADDTNGDLINPGDHDGGIASLRIARAAIRAMREPAPEFFDALAATDKMWRELNSTIVWRTFIDAASPPDSTNS